MVKSREQIAERQRLYYERHKEKIAERHRLYRVLNKEKIAERERLYKSRNKDKSAKHQRLYVSKNKEKIAERKRLWYARNKDKIKEKERAAYKAFWSQCIKKQKPKNYFKQPKAHKFDMTQSEVIKRLSDYDKRQSGNTNYHPWRDGPIIGGCAL